MWEELSEQAVVVPAEAWGRSGELVESSEVVPIEVELVVVEPAMLSAGGVCHTYSPRYPVVVTITLVALSAGNKGVTSFLSL